MDNETQLNPNKVYIKIQCADKSIETKLQKKLYDFLCEDTKIGKDIEIEITCHMVKIPALR